MSDITDNPSQIVTPNPGINMGTTGSMQEMQWGDDRQWLTEDAHWREHYHTRPYVKADRSYDHYQPAYRYGAASAARHQGREWHDVESDLESGWHQARGESGSAWQDVKDAARDAWDRVRGRGGR